MVKQAQRLAFSHLNLRFNPFGELEPAQRAALAVVDLTALPDQLRVPGTALQFIADHGHGKSTHLLALHSLFAAMPYTQIHHGDKPRFTSATVQFVDSIENLTPRQRKRVYRRSGSIAFTTHQDLSHELQQAGYRVICKAIKQTDTQQLMKAFENRIRHAQRDKTLPAPGLSLTTLQNLIQQCGTDIRAMEYQLYELFQSLQEIKDV